MSKPEGELTSLYVGCRLTDAPAEFVDNVEGLKETLRKDYEVFDFVGTVNGTSEDVYRWDIQHCVADCDMLIGVVDHPSIGLGWELGEAVRREIPTLAVAHETSKITRLILGAAVVETPVFSFERYTDMKVDVPRLVEAKFAAVRARLILSSDNA